MVNTFVTRLSSRRCFRFAVWLSWLMWCLTLRLQAQQEQVAAALVKPVRLVTVPLPITSKSTPEVIDQLNSALRTLVTEPAGDSRPLLILEFAATESSRGERSEFEPALSLARTLTSQEFSRVRSIAFLPQGAVSHAVLPAIACDEIIMGGDAELGNASADEATIEPLIRASYAEIANRRRTIPPVLALAMLDPQLKLLQAQTIEGTRLCLEADLPDIEKTTTISQLTTLKPEGEVGLFTGKRMRHELGLVAHLANDRSQLLSALQLPSNAFDRRLMLGDKARAVRVRIDGPINNRMIDRASRIVREEVKKGDTDFLCIWLRSGGGSLEEAVRFAQLISTDCAEMQVVVYVAGEARGAAAVIALCGDELVMEQGALLGGEGNGSIRDQQFQAAKTRLRDIYANRKRSWSAALVLAGMNEPVRQYTQRRSNEKRIMSEEEHRELSDQDQWTADIQPVEIGEGVNGQQAVDWGLARHKVSTFDELPKLYRLEGEFREAKFNWALVLVERLADRRLSGLLLFIGTLALFSELSHPGLSLPGLIAGVCFLLFFWAQFLHGNADMLEILLFLGGLVCLLLEMFIAPGAMIFGIAGGLMIVSSLVLASQTFVLPTNFYQLKQVPGSLLMVAGAGAGGLVGIFLLQRYLPHAPYFKRLILPPPETAEIERLQRTESLASYDHLLGKYGVAITPLVPAGKVQLGDDVIDVVSDGVMLDPGTSVIVTETMGSRVVVRRA